jgi:2-oxoisovalerate dehydrogenase E1 component beta subunit
VPLTIRLPSGGGFSGGPFHSQNPEAWFMHAPGLKVFAPSTPRDAAGLLCTAIRDPNPVIFMENKSLYRRAKEEVPEVVEAIEPVAKVVREGEDLTVVAYGAMVGAVLEAAEASGRSVEVIDLRTLVPLDLKTVMGSVAKTSRLLVVDEANETCAAGAQVAAAVGEHGFELLDAPVRRLATPDVPIPFSPPLEAAVLPGAESIGKAIDELAEY